MFDTYVVLLLDVLGQQRVQLQHFDHVPEYAIDEP